MWLADTAAKSINADCFVQIIENGACPVTAQRTSMIVPIKITQTVFIDYIISIVLTSCRCRAVRTRTLKMKTQAIVMRMPTMYILLLSS